jgi:hypothetical protein
MKFSDLHDVIDKELKEYSFNNSDLNLIYSIIIYKTLNSANLKQDYLDIFINIDTRNFNLELNQLYSTRLINDSLIGLFNKNSKASFFAKMLFEEDKNFIKKFQMNLINSESVAELSSYYNFEELSRLKMILDIKPDEFSTLLNYIDYEENDKFGDNKEIKYPKSMNFINENPSSLDLKIIDELRFINITEDDQITVDNITDKVSSTIYKTIVKLAGFEPFDFSIEDLKIYSMDEDFLKNNPIGLLLSTNTTSEFLSKIFDLCYFDNFKNDYLNILDCQLKHPSLESFLNENIEIGNFVNNTLIKLENLYPELNYAVENINIVNVKDLDFVNPVLMIDKFEIFNIDGFGYKSKENYMNYYKFSSQKNFTMFKLPITDDSYVNEESFIVTIDNDFTTRGIIEFLRLKFKDNSFIEINNVNLSDYVNKEQLEDMISKIFDIADKEQLIVEIKFLEDSL